MRRVLIVEDSQFFAKVLKEKLEQEFEITCDIAGTLAEAKERVGNNPERYFISFLDLNLPDSHRGEIVDFIVPQNIPAIVMTAELDGKIRDNILKKRILDYFVKSGDQSLSQLSDQIRRLIHNQEVKILVVDDAKAARYVVRNLLEIHRFQVLDAENGTKALELLKTETGIKMVITDYNMPEMDGFELTQEIRKIYNKKELAVIGISAERDALLAAKFLKNGANDFFVKPFIIEEFYSRINQNIEMLQYIDALKEATIKDFTTGLYNRKYFFVEGKRIYQNKVKTGQPVPLTKICIDALDKVNKSHGQEGGDHAIKSVAGILKIIFTKDHTIARFGGAEFLILSPGSDKKDIQDKLETARKQIAETEFQFKEKKYSLTISAALLSHPMKDIEAATTRSTNLLVLAKSAGGNCIKAE